MHEIRLSNHAIYGLSTTTTNADELNTNTAKIGTLWQNFYGDVMPNIKPNSVVTSVYFNYQNLDQGSYQVLVGSNEMSQTLGDKLDAVTIETGNYLKFSGKGELPQIVIETWQYIWAYFSKPDCPYERAYLTDFEEYSKPNEVDIFIGVK